MIWFTFWGMPSQPLQSHSWKWLRKHTSAGLGFSHFKSWSSTSSGLQCCLAIAHVPGPLTACLLDNCSIPPSLSGNLPSSVALFTPTDGLVSDFTEKNGHNQKGTSIILHISVCIQIHYHLTGFSLVASAFLYEANHFMLSPMPFPEHSLTVISAHPCILPIVPLPLSWLLTSMETLCNFSQS